MPARKDRAMLVGKDHAGREGSRWWEGTMLVVEDSKSCRTRISIQKTMLFCKEWVPTCLFTI